MRPPYGYMPATPFQCTVFFGRAKAVIDGVRFLYSFDRDGTVDSSGGPVPVALVRQLRERGHAVWAHGNQVLCKEAGIPGFVEANRLTGRNIHDEEISAGAELRRDRLRTIRSLFPDLPAVCIDDMDLSELQRDGWVYYSPHQFVSLMRSLPAGPLWLTARPPNAEDPLVGQLSATASGQPRADPSELFRSRYIRKQDERAGVVAGLRLPAWWWSRPYEYAWALAVAPTAGTVLDAGCGVSHPLKWALAAEGRMVRACDVDSRILSVQETYARLEADFGTASVAVEGGGITPQMASIDDLPYQDGTFDRIFCIGVLEHVKPQVRLRALHEFNRTLRPGRASAVALTVAVPAVDPRSLLDAAWQAGLGPVGHVDLAVSDDTLRHGAWGVRVFRAALRRYSEGGI